MRPAGLPSGSLTPHRSRLLASLRSVQGARPLRRSAAIPPDAVHRFLPAGHAKHGATPSGVFDWTLSGQSGAWGSPNKRAAISEKDIAAHCLPTNFKVETSVHVSYIIPTIKQKQSLQG